MDLSGAVTAYLRDRQARGYAKGTIDNDRQVLRLLLADVGNINTQRLRPQHMDVFWANRTWGPGTCNKARAIFSSFFKWCQNRGYMPRTLDLQTEARPQRVAPRKRVLIPQSSFSTFIEADHEDVRARIVLALGLYLFLRRSEITGLRWQDWNEDTETIEVYREKTKTLDTLPVCSELGRELKRWRLTYAAEVGEAPSPGYFIVPGRTKPKFVGIGKGKLKVVQASKLVPTQRAVISVLVRNCLKDSGYYQEYEGGHTLRRAGATALYDQLTRMGHDRAIRVCQAMLGHANITTTEIYLRLDLDRKVRNDLLAGQPMFPDAGEGVVLSLEGNLHGEGNTGSVPL